MDKMDDATLRSQVLELVPRIGAALHVQDHAELVRLGNVLVASTSAAEKIAVVRRMLATNARVILFEAALAVAVEARKAAEEEFEDWAYSFADVDSDDVSETQVINPSIAHSPVDGNQERMSGRRHASELPNTAYPTHRASPPPPPRFQQESQDTLAELHQPSDEIVPVTASLFSVAQSD